MKTFLCPKVRLLPVKKSTVRWPYDRNIPAVLSAHVLHSTCARPQTVVHVRVVTVLGTDKSSLLLALKAITGVGMRVLLQNIFVFIHSTFFEHCEIIVILASNIIYLLI